MQHSPRNQILKNSILDFCLAALTTTLFLLAMLRCLQNSLITIAGIDESIGAGEALELTYSRMIRGDLAVTGELNPSPLHYIMDRLWTTTLWGGQPHFHWDIYMFMRIPTSLWWCLAVVAVFLFLNFLLQRSYSPWLALLASAAAAVTLFSKNLPLFLAAQNRPYSLWLSLSIFHLIFSYFVLHDQQKIRRIGLYGVAAFSVLLALTTYVALAQVTFATAFLFFCFREEERNHGRRVLAASWLVALAVSAWYGLQIESGFSWTESSPTKIWQAPVYLFWHALDPIGQQVTYSSPTFTWVTGWPQKLFAVLCLFLPLAHLRKKFVLFTYAHAIGLTIFALTAGVVMSFKNHEVNGVRYFIFLFPIYFTLFLLSCYSILQWLQRLGKFHASIPGAALGAAALLLLAANAGVQWDDFQRLPKLSMAHFPGRVTGSQCPPSLDHNKHYGCDYWLEYITTRELCAAQAK